MGLSVVGKLRKYSRNSEELRYSPKDRMELRENISAVVQNPEVKSPVAGTNLNR